MAWLVNKPDNVGEPFDEITYGNACEITLPDGDYCDPVVSATIYKNYVEVYNTYFNYWCSSDEWDNSVVRYL